MNITQCTMALFCFLLLGGCVVPPEPSGNMSPNWTLPPPGKPVPKATRPVKKPSASIEKTDPLEPVMKTYKVNFTNPEEAANVIKMMHPDPDGLIIQTVDGKLIVKGNAAQHRAVKQMLRELDAPPKNIQINVQFDSSGRSFDREAGIRQRGPIAIRNGNIDANFEGRFRDRSNTSRENTTQMLVAMDGKSASLRVGERVPEVQWLTEYGYRHGYVREAGIAWRDVGSFLAIEPTIVSPGVVRVRLIPEISGRLENGRRESIQFTHLATEVTVADGQTIRIGGFNKDKEFSSHFFIGRSSTGKSMNTDITLTPRILD